MINAPILHYSSVEEVIENAETILEIFKTEAAVAIRGVHPTVEQQVQIIKGLGDVSGWVPNNSSNFEQQYVESHKRIINKENTSGDTIVLGWHMEHVEYDHISPIIGGCWNMVKFTADPDTGRTYVVDTAKLLASLPKEDQDFLSDMEVQWSEPGEDRKYITKAVRNHWLTGEPTLRLHIGTIDTVPENLYSVEGREPTDSERSRFVALRTGLMERIHNDESLRIVHRWNQGDILLPDLFKGAHTITGGFSSEDREFVGYWLYPEAPDADEEYENLTSAVSERTHRVEEDPNES